MTPKECAIRMKKGVFCDDDCARCGFNPAEKKRRLKEGHFQHVQVIHTLHNESNKPIHTARNICKTLSTEDLKQLNAALRDGREKIEIPQLAENGNDGCRDNSQFRF